MFQRTERAKAQRRKSCNFYKSIYKSSFESLGEIKNRQFVRSFIPSYIGCSLRSLVPCALQPAPSARMYHIMRVCGKKLQALAWRGGLRRQAKLKRKERTAKLGTRVQLRETAVQFSPKTARVSNISVRCESLEE